MANPPPAQRGGMSLYADLLDGPGAGTGTAAEATTATIPAPAPPKNPALRFQPVIRRPQQNKAKPKPKLPTLPVTAAAAATANTFASTTTTSSSRPSIAFAPAGTRTTLADWTTGDGDDDDEYDGPATNSATAAQKWQQRGGRKRKKKRLDDNNAATRRHDAYVDWDELYDPARPTNWEAYLHSDERVAAAVEWKRVLHAHERKASDVDGSESDSDSARRSRPAAFAPPAFAPPAFAPPTSFAPPSSYDAPAQVQPSPPPPPSSILMADGLVVAKAPVRFASAASPAADDDDDDYQPSLSTDNPLADHQQPPPLPPRSNRPGQAGFAARLMAKYGWTKGTGLGADESGIVNPLRHKRINAGANASGPAMGRIVGGPSKNNNKTPKTNTTAPSPVVVLRNMVDGLPDLAAEVADGQLVQEIGQECGEQYGRIERVYIDVPSQLVFLKFTETVSALRAVNALNGRIFNGSAITPSFYNADKFEAGIYQ